VKSKVTVKDLGTEGVFEVSISGLFLRDLLSEFKGLLRMSLAGSLSVAGNVTNWLNIGDESKPIISLLKKV